MSKIYARVLADDATGADVNGNLIVHAPSLEWQSVEWLNPWVCEHQVQMCHTCVDAWQLDHDIELPEGIDIE